MNKLLTWRGAGALLLATSAATAAGGAPSASGSGQAPSPHPSASGSGRGAHDAGPPETKDQRAYRIKYVTETLKHQHEITAHHVWTPEMFKASSEHWRRAYRTLRVRELAEDDHDAALVSRADAFLGKIDTHYFALMTDLTSKSPEIPAPPAVTAPAELASVAVGQPVTFKMTPVKDAWQYTCVLYEPGHSWSNWKSSWKWSDTSECTIAADDPKWAKFHAGKATFTGRAVFKAKNAKGTEYKYWSQPSTLHVTLTGGAAPGPSGSGATPPVPSPKPSSSAGGSR
jgi:hypothetical protein